MCRKLKTVGNLYSIAFPAVNDHDRTLSPYEIWGRKWEFGCILVVVGLRSLAGQNVQNRNQKELIFVAQIKRRLPTGVETSNVDFALNSKLFLCAGQTSETWRDVTCRNIRASVPKQNFRLGGSHYFTWGNASSVRVALGHFSETPKRLITVSERFVSNFIFFQHNILYIPKPFTSIIVIIVTLYNTYCVNNSLYIIGGNNLVLKYR